MMARGTPKVRWHGITGWMIALAVVTLVTTAVRAEAPRCLLFYGNSFTMRNDVAGSVARLAVAGGHPAPIIVEVLGGGKRMAAHLEQTRTSPETTLEAAAVAGRQYDAVILQGYSTEPTRIGNRQAFLDHTLALAKLVRESETGRDAAFVLYQTWPRGHGHEIYNSRFPNPAAMQQDLIEGYQAAWDVLAEEFGPESVFVAPVGASFAAIDFHADLYGRDNYHTGPVGSLLAAMVLYRTLYGGMIADLDTSLLQQAREWEHWAAITDEQWALMGEVADRQEIPASALATEPTMR